MASIQRLMRGGSLVPLPGGGFRFELDTKFKWDTPKLKRKVGEARRKALVRAGLITKRAVQKGIGRKKPRKNPVRWRIGSRHGFDLIAMVDRVPSADRLTSWRTRRNPRGMLRHDIEDDYDFRTKSVVVGPSKFPWLNELHEKGGTSRRWFKPVPVRTRGNRVMGVLTNTPPREGSGRRRRAALMKGIYSFQIQVKPRRFMERGLQKAIPKILPEFRNQISGP